MGLFSWLKRREVGAGPCDEEMEEAKKDHRKAMASLRNGRQSISTTLKQLSLIHEKASVIIEEPEGEENGGNDDIGETRQDSPTIDGSHIADELYAKGNQGV
jgi:hypothetical protein